MALRRNSVEHCKRQNDDGLESTSHNLTMASAVTPLPASVQYDDNRAELARLGFTPEPMQDIKENCFLKKLPIKVRYQNVEDELSDQLKALNVNSKQPKKTYIIDFDISFLNADWVTNLEKKARLNFTDTKQNWPEGTGKRSFTYLLLDSRITDNLPAKAGKLDKHLSWKIFVNSIFYVGKGTRAKPYSHLYKALKLWKKGFETSEDKEVQHILDIWSDKRGVVCLHTFQNVIPAEAYTYAASMIDAIGLPNLKNSNVGNYYGTVASWSLEEKRVLGVCLLYKAMSIFLIDGERQLRPDDLDR